MSCTHTHTHKHTHTHTHTYTHTQGINVDHWPWQGHSLNLGHAEAHSADWLLGPYGWSGRNHH
jgi:hypothetical protein